MNNKLVLICEDSDCSYVSPIFYANDKVNCNGECPICGNGCNFMESADYETMVTGGLDSDC